MRQKELAGALKGIVVLCLLAGALVCGLLVPALGRELAREFPEVAWLFWPCLGAFWLTCLPVLAALVLVWRMAARIGRDNSFCRENARDLKRICWLALGDTAAYLVGTIAIWALKVGFPPIFLMGVLAILLVGVAIAVVAAILSHLIQKAAELKADQDLTI